MTWRGIGSSSWSSTHSPPLQMLIIKYLLLSTYFLTQLAVLAAPLPSDSSTPLPPDPSTPPPPDPGPSASSRNIYPINPAPGPQRTRGQSKNACTKCQKAKKRCDEKRPCQRCVTYGMAEECTSSGRKKRKWGPRGRYKTSVSLSFWRPLLHRDAWNDLNRL